MLLQGLGSTGKTFVLDLIRNVAESKRSLVKMTAKTGIFASIYEEGRALHSLLGLCVSEKECSDQVNKRQISHLLSNDLV